jgi:serine/threonine protein kinase
MTKRIGRFELAESLGEGAFGSYFRGHDPATGRDVAVQTIRLDARVSAEAREAALRDARSAAALSHPNIVIVYDAGQENGHYFMTSCASSTGIAATFARGSGAGVLRWWNVTSPDSNG